MELFAFENVGAAIGRPQRASVGEEAALVGAQRLFGQGHKDLNPEPTVLEVFPQGLFSIAPQQLFCSIALVTQI